MTTTMEWIKKNWIWLTIGLIVILVIVGIIRRNKADNTLVVKLPKMPKMPGMAGRGAAPVGESAEQAKTKLDECHKGLANVRLATNVPGFVHPCAALSDAYQKAKAAESGYFMQNGYESNYGGIGTFDPFNETKRGLNTLDFAIGEQGMSLLNDGNLGNPTETN